MKAVMEKPEPVWRDFITNKGDKIKVRKLKVTYLFDMADFQDALSFDGAVFDVFRPNEYAINPDDMTLKKLHKKMDATMALCLEVARLVKDMEKKELNQKHGWEGTDIESVPIDLEVSRKEE